MKYKIFFLLFFFSLPIFAGYWDQAIEEFETQDRQDGYSLNQNLFVGSSTIRLWDTDRYFSTEDSVLNRGFGGSQVKDLLDYYDRVIKKYQPQSIVLYSGENDLDYGKNEAEVFQDFQTLVQKIQTDLNCPVLWLLPKKSTQRSQLHPKIDQLNLLIQQKFALNKQIQMLDLNSYFNLPQLFDRYLLPDLLHFNESAYQQLSKSVKLFLNEVKTNRQ